MIKFTQTQSVIIGLGVALLVGFAVASYELRDTPGEDNVNLQAPPGAVREQSLGMLPLRLRIPPLGINAKIQQVGQTKAGLMGSPSNFRDVAWYKFGPEPGTLGSAVIAGHVDNALGLSGVFKHLDTLRVGDEVDVETASEGVIRFQVTRLQVYPYDKTPLDELFGKNDSAYLNLVTCSGKWLQSKKTYDHRLIVYTTRIQNGTQDAPQPIEKTR